MVGKNGSSIDIKRLQAMYSESQLNKAVFDSFAIRERNSAETRVERMLQIVWQAGIGDASRRDIVNFFRDLQAAKCGEFFVGRRGHSSRFVWSVSQIDVGQAAAGEAETVDVLSDVERQTAEVDDAQADEIEHTFNLRPGAKITIKLPTDFSTSEAARFADFIKTLPFTP